MCEQCRLRLAWPFAGRLCDKYHNLMSWLNYKMKASSLVCLFSRTHIKDNKQFQKHIAVYEPSHEIMVHFILLKFIPQTRMRSHPVLLDVWFLVGPFVYFHTSYVRTAKALVRLRGCAGSPEPSLVASYVINTIISWADLIKNWNHNFGVASSDAKH